METDVNYTLVGTFVLILTAAIVLTVIWLSSGFDFTDFTIYKVYMKESISGLNLQAPVEYNGVNVGTVQSMKINHDNPQLVELLIRIKSDTPVTEGTRAKLGIRTLSGVGYILLVDDGKDKRPLKVLPNERYPVIETTPSLLLRLDTALTVIMNSFRQMAESIRGLLDKENLFYIKRSLYNMQQITGNLAAHSGQISGILNNTASATKQIKMQTIPSFDQTISNLNNLSEELTGVANELKENPSILIRGKEEPRLGPGE